MGMKTENQQTLFPFFGNHSPSVQERPITIHARPTLLALLRLS